MCGIVALIKRCHYQRGEETFMRKRNIAQQIPPLSRRKTKNAERIIFITLYIQKYSISYARCIQCLQHFDLQSTTEILNLMGMGYVPKLH